MMPALLQQRLASAGQRLGERAVADAAAALATRIAEEASVTVTVHDDAVRLTAPGLVARAFGSRRRGPDPRLLALLGGRP